MIILDTNVVSEIMRVSPEPAVSRWISSQKQKDVYLTTVTVAELGYGVSRLEKGRKQRELQKTLDEVLEVDYLDRILPFDETAAREYAHLAAEREAVGLSVKDFDCLILAIASVHGATVATRNVKHFAGSGVRIINPWNT